MDQLDRLGLNARVGGIEFGDEVRSRVKLGSIEKTQEWLRNLTAIGGGDGPENPVDAMLAVQKDFEFRRGALRYAIVITDAGVHERTDGSECSDSTISELVQAWSPEVFVAVLHASLGQTNGISPRTLNDALGGLFIGIDIKKALVSFNISTDTPADDVLKNVRLIQIATERDVDIVEVQYDVEGQSVVQRVEVSGTAGLGESVRDSGAREPAPDAAVRLDAAVPRPDAANPDAASPDARHDAGKTADASVFAADSGATDSGGLR